MSEVSGTDDVGVLIASELSDVSEEQDGQENYIMDLVIDGTTAVVTFFVTDDTAVADVVVAIYDESEEQMLASGTVSVSGEDSSCSIGIEGELPAYFIAKAYLLDAETHEALCTEFESLMYTEEMQGLLEKSTDDFDERLVLNLDDDSSTNYLVFSESTFIFEEESGINEITDYGDGTYTVENADDIFCALNVGDVFAYQYSDRNVLLVKVTSVTVEGSTVYLTEDTDTELSDVFEYAKIESDSEGSSMTVDDDNLEAGVSYLGKTYEYTESEAGISTVDLDMSGNFTHAVSFGINKELQSQDKSAAAGINGTLGLSLAVNVRLYLTQSYQYTQVAVDYKMGFSGSFDGELTLAEIALGEIQLMVLPTVIIGVVPQFVVQFSGSLSFNAELQGKVGISYDSDTGFVNLCTKPSLSSSVIFDGNVYIGIKLPGYAAFLNRKIAMVEIEPYTGVELDVTYTYAESSAASEDYPSEIHTCEACYCGSMYVKVGCSGKVSFFRDWICGEMTFAELTGKLNDFYYSVDHDELGYNSTCPYIGYRCTVTVVDEYDDPISDAVISGTGLEETLITDENGTVIFYLSNGSYTLTAEGANSSGSKTITVKNNIKKVTIRMLEEETEEETEETEEIEPAEGTCGENLTWYLDAEGTLTISGTGDMYTYTYYDNADSECAPWTYMYTGIAIRSIVIEEGVTSIGDYAFKYGGGWNGDSWDDGYSASVSRSYSLTSVSIPDTVVQIGDSAFSDCRGLTEISIPASVTSIGDYAFSYNTSLTSLVIPDGVTSIGERAFSFCGNLQSVTVPASVTDMGEGIFAYCYDLTDVVLKDGITSLSEYIFYYCKSLETITIPDSVTYIGESAFELCKSLNDVTLSSGLTRLEYHVFAWCTGLTSIVIPYGVTEIDIAFVECTSLSNVTLPDSVISMDSAFEHCTSLSSITLPDSVT
ncbi:MAG: leucine-rich repeat protein, partial [Lachnospiraceae bacterium]|nr:leucine-rich repeat protein [Lachnospiraceae bacterium]